MELRDQFGLFVRRAQELQSMRLIRNDALRANMNWRWDHIEGMSLTVENPDEEDLRSYLLTLRQFISPDEPVFMNKVYNLAQQHLTSDELRNNLREAREHWKFVQKGSGITITFDERQMTPEHVTDLWINGWYFHNNEAKRRELLTMMPFESMVARWRFLNHVVDASRQVLYYGQVFNIGLRGRHFTFS